MSVPSSTVTSEPVRATDSSTGSRSSGSSRLRHTTSVNSSSSMMSLTAASSTIGSMPPYVTMVVSPPAKPFPENESAG